MKKNLFFLILTMTVLSFFGCGGAHKLETPKVVDQFDLTNKLTLFKAGTKYKRPMKGHRIDGYEFGDQYYGTYTVYVNGSKVEEDYDFKVGDELTYKLELTAGNEGYSGTEVNRLTFDGVPENAFKHEFADDVTNPKGTGKTLTVTVKHKL